METQYFYPGFTAPYSTTTFYSDTVNFTYTGLSLDIKDYVITPAFYAENYYCQTDPCYADSVDTAYVSSYFCSKKYAQKNFIWGTCFEPYMPTIYFLEGCGGPYYVYYEYGGGTERKRQFIYSIKGVDTCGNYSSIAASINDNEIEKPFAVSPVPSNGISTIHFRDKLGYELEIYDITGKRIQKIAKSGNPEYVIDLTKEKSGMYFGKVIAGKNVWTFKLIKE